MSRRGIQKKCAFWVFVFFVLEKEKRRDEQDGKGKNRNQKNRKVVVLGGCEQIAFLLKMAF